MDEEQITQLKRHLKQAKMTQQSIADIFGVSQAHIGALLNGKTPFGKETALQWEERLGIRAAWLMLNDGEMLKSKYSIRQKVDTIKDNHGVVGQIHGDFHSNGGKDQLIDEQKAEVNKMFEAILIAVNGFQQSSKRHDEYIAGQDEYIKNQAERVDRIISNSYLRNERNMERIDRAIEQQNAVIAQQDKVIAQQTKLIELVSEQSRRAQDRADALIELLISKK